MSWSVAAGCAGSEGGVLSEVTIASPPTSVTTAAATAIHRQVPDRRGWGGASEVPAAAIRDARAKASPSPSSTSPWRSESAASSSASDQIFRTLSSRKVLHLLLSRGVRPEPASDPVQPGPDGTRRDAERLRDLGRFEPGPRHEQQRVAIGGTELGQRTGELGGAHLGIDLLGDAAVVAGVAGVAGAG